MCRLIFFMVQKKDGGGGRGEGGPSRGRGGRGGASRLQGRKPAKTPRWEEGWDFYDLL